MICGRRKSRDLNLHYPARLEDGIEDKGSIVGVSLVTVRKAEKLCRAEPRRLQREGLNHPLLAGINSEATINYFSDSITNRLVGRR